MKNKIVVVIKPKKVLAWLEKIVKIGFLLWLGYTVWMIYLHCQTTLRLLYAFIKAWQQGKV